MVHRFIYYLVELVLTYKLLYFVQHLRACLLNKGFNGFLQMKNPYLTSSSDVENLITFTGSPGNVRSARHSGLSALLLHDALRCAKPSTRRMKSSDPVATSIKQLLDTKAQDKRGKHVSKFLLLVYSF